MCNFFYEAEKRNLDAQITMVVHDELIVECAEEQADEVAKLLEKSMINGFSHFFKTVPMKADCEIGDCWNH